MNSEVTDAEAVQLWADLRQAFTNAGEAIAKIIATKAWEPLGYISFAEAWADRMAGVELAREVRAHVVYQMFAEGMDEQGVSDALGVGSGVGPAQVSAFKRERSNGVPAQFAKGRTLPKRDDQTSPVQAHYRKKPRPAQTVHVEFPADKYDEMKAAAKSGDFDLTAFCGKAIRDAFAAL